MKRSFKIGYIRKLNNNVNIIGTNIKKIRKHKKLSQPELCKKLDLLGVNMFIADIYEIENNKRLVKDFEVKAFCIALNVSLDDIYDNTNKLFEISNLNFLN